MTPFPLTTEERNLILALRAWVTARDAAANAAREREAKVTEEAQYQRAAADARHTLRQIIGDV